MNIHFYHVTPHPMSFAIALHSLSPYFILRAFRRVLWLRQRDLVVSVYPDALHGKVCLKSGEVVALFDVD